MSKNLGNIPRQIAMTEEQEQTYTNGINKGRKLERKAILYDLRAEYEALADFGASKEYLRGIEHAILMFTNGLE